MLVKVTSYDEKTNNFNAIIIRGKYEYEQHIILDLWAGCAIAKNTDVNTLIGKTFSIPDDCLMANVIFIPQENQLKELKK